jgi:PAS domain S-box-containing protein
MHWRGAHAQTSSRNRAPATPIRLGSQELEGSMTIRSQLRWLSLIGTSGLLIFAGVAFSALFQIEVNGPVYNTISLSRSLYAEYVPPSLNLLEPALICAKLAADRDQESRRRYVERLKTLERGFDRQHADFMLRVPEGKLKAMMRGEAYVTAQEYFRLAEQFIALVDQDRPEEARTLLVTSMNPLYDRHAAAVEQIVILATEEARGTEASVARTVHLFTFAMLAIAVLELVAGGILWNIISREIGAQADKLIRSEDAWQRSEATRKFALETAKLGEWEFDRATMQSKRSLLHDQIFGYESLLPEWGCGTFLEHVHPLDREAVAQRFREGRDQGSWDFECRILTAKGDMRWIWACGDHYRVLGDSDRMFGIVKDITERKQVEKQLVEQAEELSRQTEELIRSQKALQAQTDMLQSILNTIDEGLIVSNSRGQILVCNPAADRIAGQEGVDGVLKERPVRFRLFQTDGVTLFPADQLPMAHAFRGEASEISAVVRNPKLGDRLVRASGQPLRDECGTVWGALVTVRDVTQADAADREIRKLNEELEERVLQRTAQLEVANHELEAFTYSVSHDLRAPLRHISGFSRILMEDFAAAMAPEARNHLQRIEDGVHRMGLLVDELLNLARVGRHAVELRVTNLNAVIEEVISLLKPDTEGRSVTWEIADLPCANCDPVLIKQVFQNLLANALKFTRTREHAFIGIDCRKKDRQLVVEVRDNGVGFDMKYSDKLFGVFQRLHRSEDFEGTGIGLATVHRIVHKHGGRIWAQAVPDQGARFHFTIEAVRGEGPNAPPGATTVQELNYEHN